jgi:hypothetical protein
MGGNTTPATGVIHAQRVPQHPARGRRRLTASEVEALHGVPAATVRSWAQRGGAYGHRLYAVGMIAATNGGRDSPIYDENDLQPLIAAWRTRHPSRHQEPP